jgi:hypothetical protein
LPRAQTTPDESFGPVLVVAVHTITYIFNRTYKTLVSNKNSRRKRKILACGPNNLSGVVWAVLVASVHPVAYIVNRTYETLVSFKESQRKNRILA